jgi:hypothetical protein
VQRLLPQHSGGTTGACDGVRAEDWTLYIATHPDALGQPFTGGETVWVQGWFRDPPARTRVPRGGLTSQRESPRFVPDSSSAGMGSIGANPRS